jgi:hypothetical protein
MLSESHGVNITKPILKEHPMKTANWPVRNVSHPLTTASLVAGLLLAPNLTPKLRGGESLPPERPGSSADMGLGCALPDGLAPNLSTRYRLPVPLCFEPNQGQAPGAAGFIARHGHQVLLLEPAGLSVNWPEPSPGAALRIRFLESNPATVLEGMDSLPGHINYLTSGNKSQWRTQVPLFAKVQCRGVYPGIDLVYYGHRQQLEYDWILAPGADPRKIQLALDGVVDATVDAQGNLVLRTAGGTLFQHKPVAYQLFQGQRRAIEGRYVLSAPGDARPSAIRSPPSAIRNYQVGFQIAAYDRSQPLIIDPVISLAACLGGDGPDQAYSVATDAAGNIYVAGQTASANFPVTHGLSLKPAGNLDVFVTKLTSAGELVFSTYLGGSGNDRGYHLALDNAGNCLIVGVTTSTNFPVQAAVQPKFGGGDRDGFIAKLSAHGSALVYSTYLGGSGSDDLTDVAVDRDGNAYVAGDSASKDFPVATALQSENHGDFDAVVAKLSPQGSLVYSTYLGGSGFYDSAISIAVDGEGSALVTGYTSSADFPAVKPLQVANRGGYDAFIAKIHPRGTNLVFSTWLGGSKDDYGRSIALDGAGNIYVAGDTYSTNFPTVKPLQASHGGRRDVFVAKIKSDGSDLVYSTFLGGSGEELAALTVTPAGYACLTGVTSSTNYPTVNPLQSAFGGGTWDAFVTVINPEGSRLLFSTYLGGSGDDQGSTIVADKAGNVHIAGSTTSTNFPLTQAFQGSKHGSTPDAFVVKIAEAVPPSDEVTAIAAEPKPAEPVKVDRPDIPPSSPTTSNSATNAAPGTPPATVEPAVPAPSTHAPVVPPATPTEQPTPPPTTTNTPAAAMAPTPAVPVAPAPDFGFLLGTNLIVNGDAEADPLPAGGRTKIKITGWQIEGNLVALSYGAPGGFPDAKTPGPAERGSGFFAGGPESEATAARQTIDVTAAASAIDARQIGFVLSCYLGGMAGQGDMATLSCLFKDANEVILSETTLGPVTLADRQFSTRLLARTTQGRVPAGARSLVIILSMQRKDGAFNDGYADNLSLVLSVDAATK